MQSIWGLSSLSPDLKQLYDGNSRRLRKLQGATKIYFIYSATGKLLVEDNWTTGTSRNQIYFNGQLIATHDQSEYVRVMFKDHLGSTRSVARVYPSGGGPDWGNNWGENWVTTEAYDYNAYGDLYSSYSSETEQTTQKFTGQKRDSESNLDYFGARYYDSAPGTLPGNPRWISADTVLGEPAQTRRLNKYVYCLDDPINYFDPDGHNAQFWDNCSYGDDWMTNPSLSGPCRNSTIFTVGWGTIWAEAEPPPEPSCSAWLRYRDIPLEPTSNHSFWWVVARDGNSYIISAGPIDGYLEVAITVGRVSHARADSVAQSEWHWRTDSSPAMCQMVQDMIDAARAWPNGRVDYGGQDWWDPNSNTAARYFSMFLGQTVGVRNDRTPTGTRETLTAPPATNGWGRRIPAIVRRGR